MKIDKIRARRTDRMASSAIREILKITADPTIISFAGGLPAPELLPVDLVPTLYATAKKKYGSSILQYTTTEGFNPLRDEIVKLVGQDGIHTDRQHVAITSGSQEALDAIGKVIINEGDTVAVEGPTYLGAIQAFNAYGPKYNTIRMDRDGMDTTHLQSELKKHPTKIVYFIPNFQNPTGRDMSLSRRQDMAEIAKENPNVIFVEDDPYGKLRYKGKHKPSVKAISEKYGLDNIVYLSTFSKIFAPGIRLGFMIAASDDLYQLLVKAKQGTDLHSNSLGQAIVAEYLSGGYLSEQLKKTVKLYRPRAQAMIEACHKYLPKFSCTDPQGGMFIWIEGSANMVKLLPKAVAKKVAYVSGNCFYPNEEDGQGAARLNFTNSDLPTIERGMKILGNLLNN